MTFCIIQASTPEEIGSVRALLCQYQVQLGVDLCFQGFEEEVRNLPGEYAPPKGRLFLAMDGGTPVGCIALRDAGGRRVEMKRLFVRPAARYAGVGSALVSRIIEEAGVIGYREIVLDTLPVMTEAQRLYEGFGFRDIAPYCPNPVPGARYLGLGLTGD